MVSSGNTSARNHTLAAGNTSLGETWNCTVIPNDGYENGTATSNNVTIWLASGIGAACDECADCDGYDLPEGLFCDFRDVTPTCKNKTIESAPQCVDCVDNDADLQIDFPNDLQCLNYDDYDESDGLPAVPEFSTIGGIIILIIAGLGTALIIKKKK